MYLFVYVYKLWIAHHHSDCLLSWTWWTPVWRHQQHPYWHLSTWLLLNNSALIIQVSIVFFFHGHYKQYSASILKGATDSRNQLNKGPIKVMFFFCFLPWDPISELKGSFSYCCLRCPHCLVLSFLCVILYNDDDLSYGLYNQICLTTNRLHSPPVLQQLIQRRLTNNRC